MDIAEHIAAMRDEGQLMAAAAVAAGPDAPVPSCPDWAVRDLVRHQGGVHRWATEIITRPRMKRWHPDLIEIAGAWPADDELDGWFRHGHERLVAALELADDGLDCWTFLAAPSPRAMWARRQAHETAMHRVDAELAAGQPVTPYPPRFAADGIDELLTCFIIRSGPIASAGPVSTLAVQCTDTAGSWLVRMTEDRFETARTAATAGSTAAAGSAEAAGGTGTTGSAGTTGSGTAGTSDGTGTAADGGLAGQADCLLRGPASDLHLLLWNRRPAGSVPADGDAQVLRDFRDRVQVVWS